MDIQLQRYVPHSVNKHIKMFSPVLTIHLGGVIPKMLMTSAAHAFCASLDRGWFLPPVTKTTSDNVCGMFSEYRNLKVEQQLK